MADNENVIGLAMQLDVTDIKAGIKEVNNIIKSSKDEFNNATAGMDKWSKSSEGLTAKLGQLGKQMDAQQKAVAGYEAEIERVKGLEGDHSVQLEALAKKLSKAQAEVKKTQSQISHYNDSLKNVSRAEKEAGSELGKLTKKISDQQKELGELESDYKSAVIQFGKNSKEAKTLAAKIKELSKALEDNKGKVESSEKSLSGLTKGFEELGSKALEKSVKGVAKVGGAIAGLVGSFLATAEGTREFRTNMGKVETAFKDSGLSAKDAEDTYRDFYGVLGDEGQATEATALLAELATNQKDLKKWTDISTGVFAKFGDSLPVESLIEAANETAKTGEVTGSLADALNWAGISQDDFQKKLDGCNNEQERQKLITETLTKTYGDASKQYKETNKDVIDSQKAQADLSKAMADIGERAEPLMTAFREMGTKMLEALVPVLDVVIPFVQDHLPALAVIAGVVTGAITTLATAIGLLKLKTELATIATVAKTTAEKIASGTTKALTGAQWLLNAAMSANPIGLVVIAITALVAAFVLLWKKCDAFREFWIGLWEGIKAAFSAVVDWLKENWKTLVLFLMNPIAGLFKYFYEHFEGFRNVVDSVMNSIKEAFSKAWDGVKKAWSNVGEFFNNIIEKITGAFKDIPSKMKNVGTNLVKGLWNGIKDSASWVMDKIKGFTDGVLKGIKNFFGIHSPSKETAEIGGYLAEGMAEGIEDGAGDVIKAGEEAGSGFAEGFTKNASIDEGVKSVGNSFEKLTKTIESQKSRMGSLEKQYKSAVMTFGQTSKQAYSVAREMLTLSRQIEENELKVKNLDGSYKNLNKTLADQMKVELNNLKNQRESLLKQSEELTRKISEAGKKGYQSQAREFGEQLNAVRKDLGLTKVQIDELNANLDYMAELERRSAEEARRLKAGLESAVPEKTLNDYEKLVARIEQQKKELEGLRTEYESAVMTYGETSDKAEELSEKIRTLTGDLKKNETQVKTLDESYKNLTEVDMRSGWQKFMDGLDDSLGISKDKLDEWSKGTGKYIARIGEYFDSAVGTAMSFVDVFSDAFDSRVNAKIEKLEREMEALKEQTESEINAKQTSADQQLAILNKMYDDMEVSDQEYYDSKTSIEQDLADFTSRKNAEAAEQEKKLMAEKDRLARKQFAAQQRNSMAQTVINGAQAIIKGFADLGPIAGAINAGIQAGLTAAQLATIASQKYVPALAKGGVADGATLAMIGEAGKEAVIPLEKNTGWMETLAEKLAAIMQKDMLGGMQGSVPAYAFAGNGQTVVNNYYNQTINSPKSLTRREIYRDSKNLLSLKGV